MAVRELTISYPNAIGDMGKLLRDIRQADTALDLQAEMVGRSALAELIQGLSKAPAESKVENKVEGKVEGKVQGKVEKGTKPPAPSKNQVEDGAADADIPF